MEIMIKTGFNFLKPLLVIVLLLVGSISNAQLAKITNSALLQDINIQTISKNELKVYLTFNADNILLNNDAIMGMFKDPAEDLKTKKIVAPPSITKENNLLKLSFHNTHKKLENNVINVNHDTLKDIKINELNSKLDLLFNMKQGSFYTVKQEGNKYVVTIMADQSLQNKDKSVADFIKEIANIKKEAGENQDKSNQLPDLPTKENINLQQDLIASRPIAPYAPIVKETNKTVQTAKDLVKEVIDVDKGKVQELITNAPITVEEKDTPIHPQYITGAKAEVTKINFGLTDEKAGKIMIDFTNAKMAMKIDDSKNQQKQLIMQFKDIKLPPALDKLYDVSDFGTVVKELSWVKNSTDGTTDLIINNDSPADYVAYQINNQLIIEVKNRLDSKSASFMLSKEYSGKKISLNFQSIELRSVLQLIADFTELNLVASDTVQGNISLRLMNVPWDQALDIVLKTKNLDKRHYGNILMIAPSSELFELERAELESSRIVEKLIPLTTEYFHVNYAKAEDIAQLINSGNKGTILSERGKASFDKRTNILIVEDTPNKLKDISNILKKLDSPVKQVQIEARLVKADTNLSKELGVRWGLSAKRSSNGYRIGIGDSAYNAVQNSQASNNATLDSATGINTGNLVRPVTGAVAKATPTDTGFNIDLGLADPTGSLGLALAKLPGGTLVSLELSALEAEGLVETISSPKLVTANKVPAKIEQGQSIPYQEQTSSGATNTSFKKAVLSLTVTPQITPDNKIIMDLKVTNDTISSDTKLTSGIPVIDTQEIETQVLVDNSQTIVLGGIFTQNLENSVSRIPFLGELPLVGQLFRKNITSDKRSEFLIFITPKIIVENA